MIENYDIMKKACFIIIITVFSFFVVFAFGEVTIRIIEDSIGKRHGLNLITRVREGELKYYTPDSHFEYTNEVGRLIVFDTNSHGIRNSEIVPKCGKKRILVLGDSFVAASNTPYQMTFCMQLERQLGVYGVECINAGIAGHSNYQSYLLLKKHYKNINPDIVILMVFLGNDLRDNYFTFSDKDENKFNLKKLAKNIALRSRLIVFLHRLLFDNSQNLSYFNFEVATLMNNPDEHVKIAIRKTREIMELFKDFTSDTGIQFVVFGIASKAQVYKDFRLIDWFNASLKNADKVIEIIRTRQGYSFDNPSKIYGRICTEVNIPFYSILPQFREHLDEKLFYTIDLHWTQRGQTVAAEYVARILKTDLNLIK